MDELEMSAYRFMNSMNDNKKLEIEKDHYKKLYKITFDELGKTVLENKELKQKIKRYEKVLKEIAEDEDNCEFQSEMGEMDPYDGYGKTMRAKEVLKQKTT